MTPIGRRHSLAVRTALPVLAFLLTAQVGWALDRSKELGWHSLTHWEQPQGLPQNTVLALLQTHDGYLWVGTRAGLAKFEGVSFTTFDSRDPSQLGDNEVQSLAEAADGSLWVATYGGGVSRLSHGKFAVYNTKNGLLNDFVSALCADREGGVWIATDEGLSHFKDGKFTNFTTRDGLTSKACHALFIDRDGSLLAGGVNGTISQVKDGRASAYAPARAPFAGEIKAILRDREQALWIASTVNGIVRIKDGISTRFGEGAGLPSSRVNALYEDAGDYLWIGTGAGLVRYKNGGFSVQPLSSAPPERDQVVSIASDREGSLWVGTGDHGFYCLRRDIFSSYTRDEGLIDNYVAAIIQDKNGDILIGSRKGVSVLKEGQLSPYAAPADLPEISLLCLLRSRDGTIWMGTEGGLYRTEPAPKGSSEERLGHHFVHVESPGIARNISVRKIFEDRSGTLWLGTTLDGLVRYRDNRGTTFTTKDGLSHNSVRGLCEDRDGSLWIGTRGGGLDRFKDGKFTVYTKKDGLVDDTVQTLYMDADNTLWIGARNGLGRWKDGKFTSYTVADGLYINYIGGITEDHRGNLWMNSSKGVFWVSVRQLNDFAEGKISAIKSTSFGTEHGLSSTVGTAGVDPSAYTATDGQVWFASTNGANATDPSALSINQLAPPVHLVALTVDQRPFAVDQPALAPPGRGDLMFGYDGVSFLAPEKMRFKYQLKGYDLDWVDAGARRQAFYSNIPPGSYSFRVIAANSDGVWNDTGATFNLYLRPHVYQTGWFRILLGLFVVGVALGAVRRRIRSLRHRAEELRLLNIELERRIAERTAELTKSYDALRAAQRELIEISRLAGIAEVATGVLHNLGNALNSVNTSATLAMEYIQKLKIPSIAKVAHLMAEQGDRLADFIATDPRGRQMTGYLSLLADQLMKEQGEALLEIERVRTNVAHITELVAAQQSHARVSAFTETVAASELVEYAFRIAESSMLGQSISITREFAPVPPVKVTRDKAVQILMNLIRNAADSLAESKQAQKGIVFRVCLSTEGRVQIHVSDNGCGISPENLTRVFAFGFTTKKTGHGFGLHSSALAAKEMGGSLHAESAGLGKGATFILELPPE